MLATAVILVILTAGTIIVIKLIGPLITGQKLDVNTNEGKIDEETNYSIVQFNDEGDSGSHGIHCSVIPIVLGIALATAITAIITFKAILPCIRSRRNRAAARQLEAAQTRAIEEDSRQKMQNMLEMVVKQQADIDRRTKAPNC